MWVHARRSALAAIGLLVLLAGVSIAIALNVGSTPTPTFNLWDALWHEGHSDSLSGQVVMQLRLPRALTAFACGGLLALAGAMMQALLRNPLADPYILGVSGGAAVGALLAMTAGLATVWIHSASLTGAMLSTVLVFTLAHGRGGWTPTRLVLTGVVVAAGWGALISFILAVSPQPQLRSMMFWLMGDLSGGTSPTIALTVLALGLLCALPLTRGLTLLGRGELLAASLGVPVAQLRYYVYGLTSVLTATAVTTAGSIGFIGLVVPHLVRLVMGNDYRLILPASALLGGSMLVLADTLARTALAPQQLPVGVLTALLGVPIFLYLLHRARP